MPFDIYNLDKLEDPQRALEKYRNSLLDLFSKSPEGTARLQVDPGMGFWTSELIERGYVYLDVTLTQMTSNDVEGLLTQIFPEKISLFSPEDADDALPELIAFWEYLRREYGLPHAERILEYLRKVKPAQFRKWMNDPSRFGMAKSFFMMGQAAGFDMTDEKQSEEFIKLYNASLAMQTVFEEPSLIGGSRGGKKSDPKERKLRKIAKASRRKNRGRK